MQHSSKKELNLMKLRLQRLKCGINLYNNMSERELGVKLSVGFN